MGLRPIRSLRFYDKEVIEPQASTTFFCVGNFEEKCQTFTVGSFLYALGPFLLICSTTRTTDVQNILEMSKSRPKQNRRPEPRKHTKYPHFGYLFLVGVFEENPDSYSG